MGKLFWTTKTMLRSFTALLILLAVGLVATEEGKVDVKDEVRI